MYRIISDSACDLSQTYIKENDVTIVPLSVSFDGENYYRDNIDISRNDAYQKMIDDPNLYPKTSLPSVELYYNTFQEYVEQDIAVVCFTISTILSGSYNSAKNAMDMIMEDYPDAKLYVINSNQNTVTQAQIVDQMVRMRDANVPLDEALEKINKVIDSARIFFTVGSLDYLQMGGRIGKVAAAASKIDVKPVIIMKDGDISLGGIGRNRNKLKKKVLTAANKYLAENNKDDFVVSVGYGYDASEGVSFMGDVEEVLDVKLQSSTNVAIGIITATHTGPHAIGIGVVKKYETV